MLFLSARTVPGKLFIWIWNVLLRCPGELFCLVDFFFPFNLIRSIWFESGTHKTKINQALVLLLDFIELEADIFELGKME